MSKLKDYIHGTIITQGYSLEYVNFEEHHLDKLIELAQEAKEGLKTSSWYEELSEMYNTLYTITTNSGVTEEGKDLIYKDIRKRVLIITGASFWSVCYKDFLEEFGRYLVELQDEQ